MDTSPTDCRKINRKRVALKLKSLPSDILLKILAFLLNAYSLSFNNNLKNLIIPTGTMNYMKQQQQDINDFKQLLEENPTVENGWELVYNDRVSRRFPGIISTFPTLLIPLFRFSYQSVQENEH